MPEDAIYIALIVLFGLILLAAVDMFLQWSEGDEASECESHDEDCGV